MTIFMLVWVDGPLGGMLNPGPKPSFALHVGMVREEAAQFLGQEVLPESFRVWLEDVVEDAPGGNPHQGGGASRSREVLEATVTGVGERARFRQERHGVGKAFAYGHNIAALEGQGHQ